MMWVINQIKMTGEKSLTEIEKELYEALVCNYAQKTHRELEQKMTLEMINRFRRTKLSLITLNDVILWMCGLFVVEKKNIAELLLKLHFIVIGRAVDHPEGFQELAKEALVILGKYDLESGFGNQSEETKRKLHSLICTK